MRTEIKSLSLLDIRLRPNINKSSYELETIHITSCSSSVMCFSGDSCLGDYLYTEHLCHGRKICWLFLTLHMLRFPPSETICYHSKILYKALI